MNLRVLLYPNITYQKNLEADSYVVLLGPLLRRLAETDPDFEFVGLFPKYVDSLRDLPNLSQVPYPLPTYPNTMRTHFDAEYLLRVLDLRRRSFDIVYSHLPEHTLALRNLFANRSNETPAFTGYCHWWEIPENTDYSPTMFPANLYGMLAMDECGVNSEWVRTLILRRAEAELSPSRHADLADVIRPHYLGHSIDPVDPTPITNQKLIVFNHRANGYTGFSEFVEVVDRLWHERQDFRVLLSLAGVQRPWAIEADTKDRDDYLSVLSSAYVGVGNFKTYSAWSLSTMDGLALGVPYVLPDGLCYPEMVGSDYPLLFDDLYSTLDRVLDDESLRDHSANRAREIAETYRWEIRAQRFSLALRDAKDRIPEIGERSRKIDELADILDREGPKTKKELTDRMRWGVNIKWTPYRTALRNRGYEIRGDTYGPRRG